MPKIWPNPVTNPDFYDPFASYERHPILPAGINADDVNGDVHNGSGTNWPIWPVLFDTYEGFIPIIVTDEMEEVFDGCADYVVPCIRDVVYINAEISFYTVGGTWPDIVPPAMSTRIVLPFEPRDTHINNAVPPLQPPGKPAGVAIPTGIREQDARRPE